MEQSRVRNLRILLAVVALLGAQEAMGQAPASQQQPAPAPSTTEKAKTPDVAPLTLDVTPPPVSAEEDAAVKEFREMPNTDLDKKEQAGEGFLQKYPQSRYRSELYVFLEQAYLSTGQADKVEATGDKELEINPNDALTLATVGF